MNGVVIWRDGRGKYSLSIQMFIEALTKPIEVVPDAHSLIGVAFSHWHFNPCNVRLFVYSTIYNC